MTINSADIKLLESERMSDASDGGGRRTSRVVPDGVAGNVFPKVSRVDSVYGRVNLRKVYGHVATANLDMYAGAHFIVTDAPDNGRIHVTAFTTASDFDTRVAARDRIESYVIAGPVSRMTLYGRQLLGSQAVLVYQRTTEPLPEIGEVIAVSNETGDTTTNQQFVRITDVSGEVRTFTDQSGDFTVLVITLKIGAPLRYEFYGPATPQRLSGTSTTGRVRSTTVADAARYFGIQPLALAATTGALELTVSSVYAPLVPTTQRETPLSLATVVGADALVPAAAAPIAEYSLGNIGKSDGLTHRFILPRPAIAGSVRIRLSGAVTTEIVTDNGLGVIPQKDIVGVSVVRLLGGVIDYAAGVLDIGVYVSESFYNVNVLVSYIPAASVSQPAHTLAIPITLGTRGTVYSVPLLPIPAPGTLLLDYRALGKWYRLRDEGNGELVGGDVQYGTGTIDYVNGAATVTLGALPDVGSSVILSWGSPVHYEILTDTPGSKFETTLSPGPINPGSVTLTWTDGGLALSAADNGSGLLTGDATGTVEYQTGRLSFTLPRPILGDVSIGFSQYVAPAPVEEIGLTYNYGAQIDPYTVVVSGVSISLPDGTLVNTDLQDNGSGGLVCSFPLLSMDYLAGDTPFGTVDYASGAITVAASSPVKGRPLWIGEEGNYHWQMAPPDGEALVASVTKYSARIHEASPTLFAKTQTMPIGEGGAGLAIRLGPQLPLTIVPGSVMFSLSGKIHIDRNGVIYTDLQSNGSGMVVGSINYATGEITINDYLVGSPANPVILACLGQKGDYTSTKIAFRTAGSPLRPASTYVQITTAKGELLSGTSDQNGDITGLGASGGAIVASVTGKVEQTSGVLNLDFNVPVLPGTLRYSAVVLSNLPLNADILGLDPTRLPSDGRAPIYRPADVVVIHHTGAVDAGTPSAGTILDAGRTGLSTAWVEDSAKVKLDPALYTVDLGAGTVTMATPLDLSAYTPPLTMRHRIEEMGLLSDVQINGQVSLTAPLLRDYPLGSMLSSALLFGDLQARVTNVFEQTTWTGEWQDTPIGSTPPAQYDDVNYPIETLNNGSVTERWRIQFINSTTFQVIGQNLGVIATGSTGADLQPINTLTGLPYFTLRKNGWGMGWAVGNQLRFDTLGATAPIWLARTVLPGATLEGDSFDAQLRGDVD